MSSNIVNQVSFLRTTRDFPTEDPEQLSVECNKAYLDTANAVNSRIIGIFPVSRPAVTGESWFFTNQKQQTLRQVYDVTSTTSIAHGLTLSQIPRFTRLYGNFTDSTNWYGFIPGTPNLAIPGQIVFYLTPTNIVFVVGAGAPTVSKGQVVLEWLSNV